MTILRIAENYKATGFGHPWSYTVTTETHEIHMVCVDYSDRRSVNKSARVYGPSVTTEMPQPPYSTRGEDKAVDKAWDAYNREEIKLMRAEIEAAAQSMRVRYTPANSEFASIVAAMTEGLKFSRKAGCSCGCSAGFVSPLHASFRGNRIVQISVSKVAK